MRYYVYLWSGSGPCNAWALLRADTRPTRTHRMTAPDETQSSLLWRALCPALINSLLIALCRCLRVRTLVRACVQELSPSACGRRSSLPAAAAAAHSRDNTLAGSGTCSRRRHEMRPCPCAQTAKHNNYQPAAPSPTGWRVEREGKRWMLRGVITHNEGGNLRFCSLVINSLPPLVLT